MGTYKEMEDNTTNYEIKKVRELISGDIVLQPIFREDGLLLVNRYTMLTPLIIGKIKLHMNSELRILIIDSKEKFTNFINSKMFLSEDFIYKLKEVVLEANKNFNMSVSLNEYISENTILRKVNSKQCENLNEESILITSLNSLPLWNNMESYFEGLPLKNRAEKAKEMLLEKVHCDDALFKLLNKIKEYDDLLIMHSINTLCISLLIGVTLELTEEELVDLGIAAIFCNIGYLKYDKKVFQNYINNGEELHLEMGHIKASLDLLTESDYCRKKSIFYGIYDHHEQYCGGGVPFGKKGNEISLFGRILKIAVEYDDSVGGHFANSGKISYDTISMLLDNKDKAFDDNILRIFMYRSNLYKIGKPIRVSITKFGEIVGFTNFIEYPHKPVIKFKDGSIIDTYNK
jgi:HD-GYP domain-containing protein (c-di-GMP phosphodiesterase class II)